MGFNWKWLALAGGLGIGFSFLGSRRARMRAEVSDAARDIVEECSVQSFPASDAPSWTTAAAGTPRRFRHMGAG